MTVAQVIDRVKKLGFTLSDELIDAMRTINREYFVTDSYRKEAYKDRALPIICKQTISAPHMYLMMLSKEALSVKKGDKILEIGTGSGYNVAFLSYLTGANGFVISVERHQKLVEFAKNNLEKVDLPDNYEIIHGDGTQGVEGQFDKIIITASGPYIPDILLDRLKEGGIMVFPIKTKRSEKLIRIDKIRSKRKLNSDFFQTGSSYFINNSVSISDLGGVRFVPLIGEFGFNK